ncbi:MAG: 16S rRNA (guanine(966)-N(2))-methyltransferase RsmD [Oscillospiraceae bacterium]|nr:16S rRNA (guanine(966)-N(2))-methyltransferase RsmD [Oscillospiraceae bacterium]MDY3791561.1 16S rRNA (guanine(966)-N(2))-methyltransferase RsmD [Oscillospiraceae bacterium]MDY6209013.1 16S rRNA (guanine(966)-N(2))-methyltransferase RsmD [Oscillospiraceae bacterium]
MRVITGIARGRKLKTLEGEDVRPTTDMVKEAIFSIIQFDIEGSVILDLFCGSGQLGIEALSRGAKYCRFVDKSQASAECARENIAACGFKDDCGITVSDSLDFLRGVRMTFDIALLDPPYRNGLIEKAMPLLEGKMSDRGIVVCEHEKGLVLPDEYGKLKKSKTYRYGKIEVTVYRVPLPNEEEE